MSARKGRVHTAILIGEKLSQPNKLAEYLNSDRTLTKGQPLSDNSVRRVFANCANQEEDSLLNISKEWGRDAEWM